MVVEEAVVVDVVFSNEIILSEKYLIKYLSVLKMAVDSSSIIGVREIITALVRRIGLVITMKSDLCMIEIAIDNSINMIVLECNILPIVLREEILNMIEDDVEILTQEEIGVYLRMTLWILNKVHSSIDGVIFIYNNTSNIEATDLLDLCTDILRHL